MSERPSTAAVWSQLSDDLRRFIRRRVADDHTADDLLQETFLRIHRHLDTLGGADRLAAWVYRIARNVIHDHYRKSPGNCPAPPDAEPATGEDPLAGLRCTAGGWLRELIQLLPEKYREAVQLSDIDQLPLREIAERQGVSLSGVKSRVQRGRVMLRDVLDQCCRFELDRRGNVMDYQPKPDRTVCRDCGEGGDTNSAC